LGRAEPRIAARATPCWRLACFLSFFLSGTAAVGRARWVGHAREAIRAKDLLDGCYWQASLRTSVTDREKVDPN
jgi:hypothetical protein